MRFLLGSSLIVVVIVEVDEAVAAAEREGRDPTGGRSMNGAKSQAARETMKNEV